MPGHAIPVSGPANARTAKFSTILRMGASETFLLAISHANLRATSTSMGFGKFHLHERKATAAAAGWSNRSRSQGFSGASPEPQADKEKARQRVPRFETVEGNCPSRTLLESGKVYSLRALTHTVGLYVEGNLLSVGERAQASVFDSRDVNEHILLTVVGRDEAEALGGVEKLYCASRGHGKLPV